MKNKSVCLLLIIIFFISVSSTSQASPPVADAGPYDHQYEVGELVTFDGSGSFDDEEIVNYTWTFQQGGALVQLYGVNPSHTFLSIGYHEVTLNVTDNDGNWDTDETRIEILPRLHEDPEYIWIVYCAITLILLVILILAVIMKYRGKSKGD